MFYKQLKYYVRRIGREGPFRGFVFTIQLGIIVPLGCPGLSPVAVLLGVVSVDSLGCGCCCGCGFGARGRFAESSTGFTRADANVETAFGGSSTTFGGGSTAP
jgi:hypothetical protein